MITTIELDQELHFGDTPVDRIEVHSLSFSELTKLWEDLETSKEKPEVALQRARIRYQTHFLSSGKRVHPTADQLSQLPAAIARKIVAALPEGQGPVGEIIGDGDGATAPVIYKLGTPIAMKGKDGNEIRIEELEFMASTYGEIEDILAAETEVLRTLALLAVAKPIGAPGLTVLPQWAVDRISLSDGVTIMRDVASRF